MRIGVDIGTTNIKAAVFDESGSLIAERSKPNSVSKRLGWDSLDVGFVVDSVLELIGEIVNSVGEKRGEISGIGFTSMGETVIPIDGEKAIFDGIYWYETCTMPQFENFCRNIAPSRVHKLTALNPSWIYSVSKIMKIRDDYPDIYERAKYFLDVSGFMAFLLSGVVGFDSTIACRTMLLDIQNRRWSGELLTAAGLDESKFPPIKNPGEKWGTLKEEFAKKFGLSRDAAITTGGQDHIAAAFSAGIKHNSQVMISVGTSAAFYTPADISCYLSSEFLKRFYLAGGYSAFEGGAYILTGMSAGGFCIDWFVNRVLGCGYSVLGKMTLRQTGAIFLPNLRAQMSGFPAGGFTELTDTDDGESLLQSIMESLAFECRYTVEEAFKAKGSKNLPDEFVMVGGAAKNQVFMKILSSVMHSRIKKHPCPEAAAAMGAALAGSQNKNCATIFEEYQASELDEYLDKKYLKYLKCFRGETR